jgi:5-methylcytosine-specific restriction protein B
MLPDHTLLRGVTVKADGQSVNIDLMLKIINERITYLYDREHTLGHAFFMGLKVDNSIENLAAIFENSVIPLLQEYFYEDYEKIRLVLGDNAKKDVSTQFVAAEDIPQDTFEGDVSDEFDIPDKKYTILYDNFTNIMAYKGISRKL